jgi:hypothetical protein
VCRQSEAGMENYWGVWTVFLRAHQMYSERIISALDGFERREGLWLRLLDRKGH